jgi:uncharacterized membrane protein
LVGAFGHQNYANQALYRDLEIGAPCSSACEIPILDQIAKALSWRIVGSLDTFVLSLIFTRSFQLAGSIVGTEMFTKMMLYYFHERLWAAIPWHQRS